MRKTDAGVASGPLHQRSAGLQRALGLCVIENAAGGPILYRTARVQEFGLAEDFAAGLIAEGAQTNQGRVADGAREAEAGGREGAIPLGNDPGIFFRMQKDSQGGTGQDFSYPSFLLNCLSCVIEPTPFRRIQMLQEWAVCRDDPIEISMAPCLIRVRSGQP